MTHKVVRSIFWKQAKQSKNLPGNEILVNDVAVAVDHNIEIESIADCLELDAGAPEFIRHVVNVC